MSDTRTIKKSLVINNVEGRDSVTVELDISVECDCAGRGASVGSYIDTSPARR